MHIIPSNIQGSDLGVGDMTALCWLHYALDEMVQTGRYLHGYDVMEGTHMRVEVVDIVAVLFVVAAVLLVVAAASIGNINLLYECVIFIIIS